MAGDDGDERLGTPAVTRVLRIVRDVATQSDRYSHAIRERLGMHSTDLTAMGIISDAARDGAELTPSQLAAELHLSASAVTSLVTRLEHIGHVTRHPHVADGRKVVVEITPSAADLASTSFQPLSGAIREVLASRSDAELALVEDVLSDIVRAMTEVCEMGRGSRAAGLVAPRSATTLDPAAAPAPRPRSSGDRAPLS